MSAATKTMDTIRRPMVVVGWGLAILALILCVTALVVSGNPLFFVFGVIVVSLLGIVVSLLPSEDNR